MHVCRVIEYAEVGIRLIVDLSRTIYADAKACSSRWKVMTS